MIKASLIIPTYNRGAVLADTIRMAAAQDYADYEVIVVDQDPIVPEIVQRAISETGGRARLLHLLKPSLTAARNAGVRVATGEIVVFIDDDVIIEPDFIATHARAFEDGSVGGATGLTLLPGECDNEQVRESQLSLLGSKERFPDGTSSVYWTTGCCSSFRRSTIVEAGMSDERFTGGAWSEDADLSVRVANLGYKLIFDPRIRLIHLALPSGGCENRTEGETSEQKVEEQCRLYVFFCLKNRAIFGPAATATLVWRGYRQFAFNRTLLKSLGSLGRRQFMFTRSLRAAVRLLGQEAVAAGV